MTHKRDGHFNYETLFTSMSVIFCHGVINNGKAALFCI